MERALLAAARYENGWSQEEVAERVGVTRNTLSKWERGIVAPYPLHVHRLCKLYGKSAAELDLVHQPRTSVKAEPGIAQTQQRSDPAPDKSSTALHHQRNTVVDRHTQEIRASVDATPDLYTQHTMQNIYTGQSAYNHMLEAKTLLNAVPVRSASSQDEISSVVASQLQEVLPLLSASALQNIIMGVQELERTNMDIGRRDFLHMLSTSLVFVGLSDENHSSVQTLLNGDQMALLETEIAKRWSVYHSGDTIQAHENFHLWLAEVERFVKRPTSHLQSIPAYSLLSRSYQLQGSIFRDKMDYTQAHNSYKKAFLAADEFNNAELKSSSLARRGVTFIQQQKPIDAIQYLEGALLPIDDLDFPYLKGYIFQALSEAHAMAQHHEQSQKNIELAEQVLVWRNNVIESSNCQLNTTSITAQNGVNSVLLQNYTYALDLLNRGLNTYAPSLLRGRARLIAQKAEAYYGLGCIDESVSAAKDALGIARSIGSQKTISRIKNLCLLLHTSPYGKEKSVIQLGMMLATN